MSVHCVEWVDLYKTDANKKNWRIDHPIGDQMTESMSSYLERLCDLSVGPAGVEFDPDFLYIIRGIAGAICEEYENDTSEWDMLGNMFDLGGDDDVDYCGTHVDVLCDLLGAWCDANKIKHTA